MELGGLLLPKAQGKGREGGRGQGTGDVGAGLALSGLRSRFPICKMDRIQVPCLGPGLERISLVILQGDSQYYRYCYQSQPHESVFGGHSQKHPALG